MFELFVTAFVMLFLVIDPIGLLPIFISLTLGNNKNRLKIGLRACSVALGILLLFGLLGENLLSFIGIGMPAFKISGGLLLFLTAVEMLFSKRVSVEKSKLKWMFMMILQFSPLLHH